MRRIAEHKRKIWKAMEHTIGMRIPLFLAFLILTLVPLLVQVRFTSGYFYQSHVEERMAEAQNRSLILYQCTAVGKSKSGAGCGT